MDILAVACALVATALYCNTLQAGFVYDDRRAILTNPDLLASTPWYRLLENDFWGTPLTERGSHGSYRPLCVATFRLNHFFGSLEPWGYHLVNVALHAACTVLVVRVARKVLPGRSNLAHAITGFLFAVHPIHSEAVAGIVGRADLLACLLTLTSFLTYSGHCNRARSPLPLLLALVSSTLATLAKETGISSLALCLLWELCRGEPTRKGNCLFTRGRSVIILSSGLVLLALGRLRLAGGRPEFASADNPTARHPSRLTRGLTFLYLPAASARMLLCPSTLSFDWSMDAVPRITSPLDPRNLESVCLYLALIAAGSWAVRRLRQRSRRDPAATTTTTTTTTTCSPLRQQVYLRTASSRCPVCAGRRTCHTDGCRAANNNNNSPFGDCHCAKRPSNGGGSGTANVDGRQTAATAVAVSLGFLVLPFLPASNLFFYVGFVIAERILYLPSVGVCLAVGAAVSACYRIARRNGSRKRGRAVLFAAVLLIGIMSAKTLVRNADWRDEESLYKSALHVNPPKAYGNLGSVLSEQGRVTEAEEAFVQALRYRPNMADVHYNLGILQQGRKNYDEAILSYQRAIHFRPSLAQAYVNLGAALISVGRGTEAAAVLRAGASLDGSGLKDKRTHEAARVQALLQLGALYADQGRLQRALSAYREALRALPDHYPPQEYVDASSMQHRDAQDVLEEFSYELSKMGGRCMDIGSGPGDITKQILHVLRNDAKVVGADISQAMVNHARQKHADEERLSYAVLDIETSELPSDHVEQYDNVVSFYCLHWCDDLWRAFRNIYKLLRPSGKALVMFLGYHFGFEAYVRLKQDPRYQPYLQDACRYVPYFQRFKCKDARASLRKMLEDIGFDVLHCSKRERSYKYSKQSLKNQIRSVNPFIARMPDEMRNEFVDLIMREVMANGDMIMNRNAGAQNEQSEHIVFRYYLLIAYVEKPPLIS